MDLSLQCLEFDVFPTFRGTDTLLQLAFWHFSNMGHCFSKVSALSTFYLFYRMQFWFSRLTIIVLVLGFSAFIYLLVNNILIGLVTVLPQEQGIILWSFEFLMT